MQADAALHPEAEGAFSGIPNGPNSPDETSDSGSRRMQADAGGCKRKLADVGGRRWMHPKEIQNLTTQRTGKPGIRADAG